MNIYEELGQFFDKVWDEEGCLGCGTLDQRTAKGKELSGILKKHDIELGKVVRSIKPLRLREAVRITDSNLLFIKCISEEALMGAINGAIHWEE